MNRRFAIFALVSVLPWLYIGAALVMDFVHALRGFGALPFFALLFAKQLVLKRPKERKELMMRNNPYWKDILILFSAILLTVTVIAVSTWINNSEDLHEGWSFKLIAIGVVSSLIAWDIRRAYYRTKEIA